jgi:hypothetical protein
MAAPKSSRHARLIGDPSPVEVRRIVNDLVEDVRELRAALDAALQRIAALEAAG